MIISAVIGFSASSRNSTQKNRNTLLVTYPLLGILIVQIPVCGYIAHLHTIKLCTGRKPKIPFRVGVNKFFQLWELIFKS